MGVMQSVASLARAVGPSVAALIIYSAVAHMGYDNQMQNMSDASILRTFWTAAAIQFGALLLAVYFARMYAQQDIDRIRKPIFDDSKGSRVRIERRA